METLLISLHPRHSQNILEGRKTIELRKKRPRDCHYILIYETLPTAAIIGYCNAEEIVGRYTDQWCYDFASKLCLTPTEIRNYLGDRMGYGIRVKNPQRITPIPLSKMREVRILPPQGFRYLSDTDLEKLGVKFND